MVMEKGKFPYMEVRVACVSVIKEKMRRAPEISEKEVTSNREKGSILKNYFKEQEDQFKLFIKLISKWVW